MTAGTIQEMQFLFCKYFRQTFNAIQCGSIDQDTGVLPQKILQNRNNDLLADISMQLLLRDLRIMFLRITAYLSCVC